MLLSRRLQLALTVVTLLGMLASIYLVAKLAPLKQDISLNASAIEANNDMISLLNEDYYNLSVKVDELIKGQARIEGILLGK